MPSTNGHDPMVAVLYARVSTDEQARSGYSLAQQLEALRAHSVREGYEVLEEVTDPGQSGASLERPGMDRVRDLVVAGGVSVVLAQDRDRFAREPAYHYLLRREFDEYGTKIRALNDKGDDSPEGQLADGIMDQIARFERAKTAERTRRGKVQKAREGKVIAARTPNYGFRYNAARDGYEVDEDAMRVVRRVFRMIGAEGRTLFAVKKALEREGVPTPQGARFWTPKVLRGYVLDDLYKPHTREELLGLVETGQMARDVFERLNPSGATRYGVWWFNRRRTRREQVSEVGPDGERAYRKRSRNAWRPRSEWVAVPVPDSGVPREWVEAARAMVEDNRAPSAAGRRFWELSGGIIVCAECLTNLMIHNVSAPRLKEPGHLFYYRCRKRNRDGAEACPHKMNHRADKVEPLVWGFVSGLLKDPERLAAGLDEMIDSERRNLRGDPERETKACLEQIADIDQERRGYLKLATKGHMGEEELERELVELQAAREAAEGELRALRGRQEALERLESDRDALLGTYAAMALAGIDLWGPEDRRQVYKMLRLRVLAHAGGTLEVSGVFGDCLVLGEEHQGTAVAQDQVQLPESGAVVKLGQE